MFVPWRDWLARSPRAAAARSLVGRADRIRRRCSSIAGGANFALLMFLTIPFIAVVHVRSAPRRVARRRAAGRASCVAAIAGLPAGATAMRTRARRGRGRGRHSSSGERSAARLPRIAKPRTAPSSSAHWRPRRITGSRTTCRPSPTCSCSAAPTTATAGPSTTPPPASSRSRRCTGCSPRTASRPSRRRRCSRASPHRARPGRGRGGAG